MKCLKPFTRKSLLLLMLLIVNQSCSTYKHTVVSESGSTEVKRTKLHTVVVIRTDDSKVKGILYDANLEGIAITKDLDYIETNQLEIPFSEIKRLKIGKKGQAGRGALAGSLLGASIGAIVGYSQGDDDSIILSMTKEDKAAINGILFGAIGAGVGSIIGSNKKKFDINGNQSIYNNNVGTIQSYSFTWNKSK